MYFHNNFLLFIFEKVCVCFFVIYILATIFYLAEGRQSSDVGNWI